MLQPSFSVMSHAKALFPFQLWRSFSSRLSTTTTSSSIQEKGEEIDLLSLISKTTQDGIWDFNLKQGSMWLSPRWKEMLGYRDVELENSPETVKALMLPEDYLRSCKLADCHIRHNIPFHGVFRFRHKDNSVRHIMSRAHTVKGCYGEPVRMVGTHTDVTDQLQLQEKLSDTEARLSLFHCCIPSVVCRFTSSNNRLFSLSYVSEHVTELCGLCPSVFYANNDLLLSLIHPGDWNLVLKTLRYAHHHKTSWSVQCRIKQEGKLGWLHAQFKPVEHMGDKISWEGVIMDITQFR